MFCSLILVYGINELTKTWIFIFLFIYEYIYQDKPHQASLFFIVVSWQHYGNAVAIMVLDSQYIVINDNHFV